MASFAEASSVVVDNQPAVVDIPVEVVDNLEDIQVVAAYMAAAVDNLVNKLQVLVFAVLVVVDTSSF